MHTSEYKSWQTSKIAMTHTKIVAATWVKPPGHTGGLDAPTTVFDIV